MEPLVNWAGNYAFRAARLHQPESVAELQEIVARSRRVKALGTRHSFNDLADTPEDLVSTARFDKIVHLDPAARTVTVEGGIRHGDLARYLHREGWALHNLASLPHISVAGAVATATHGSGVGNRCLSAPVTGLEMVTASGEIVTLSRETDEERFRGAVVGLGALGIVTRLTLAVEPTYEVRQDVYENLLFAEAVAHFADVMSAGYSVSLFTRWAGPIVDQVWRKRRVDAGDAQTPPVWFGATLAHRDLHPIPGVSAENCTPQCGVPGPWHERLPHFRLEFTPSSGEELQSEFFVPFDRAGEALQIIDSLRDRIAPLLQISEIRTIAADDFWMSPFRERPSVGIHFTWKADWPGVRALLPAIEAALAPFDARPHWAKLFTMPGERITELYADRLPTFRRLASEMDPAGKFRNVFLERTGVLASKEKQWN